MNSLTSTLRVAARALPRRSVPVARVAQNVVRVQARRAQSTEGKATTSAEAEPVTTTKKKDVELTHKSYRLT